MFIWHTGNTCLYLCRSHLHKHLWLACGDTVFMRTWLKCQPWHSGYNRALSFHWPHEKNKTRNETVYAARHGGTDLWSHTQEVVVGELQIWGYPGLHSESRASLDKSWKREEVKWFNLILLNTLLSLPPFFGQLCGTQRGKYKGSCLLWQERTESFSITRRSLCLETPLSEGRVLLTALPLLAQTWEGWSSCGGLLCF